MQDSIILDKSGLSLRAHSVWKHFGGVQALKGACLTINQASIHSLIGPNGAGKTTLINVIMRLIEPDQAELDFEGHNLLKHKPSDLVGLGISRTFQRAGVVPSLTSLENVMLGFDAISGATIGGAILRTPSWITQHDNCKEKAWNAMKKLGVEQLAGMRVEKLSLIERRYVELARAFVSHPRLMLLDEPTAGLSATEIDVLVQLLYSLKHENVAILLVEHNIDLVQRVSDRVTVLNFGSVIAEGSFEEVIRNEEVKNAYWGG